MTVTGDRPGCLAAIRRVLGLGAAPQQVPSGLQEELPYRVRDDFLSPAERSLYGVLCAAVGEWATVCPKIALADVFYPQSGDRSANASYRNQITQKHVDFLLCNPGSMRPLLGVHPGAGGIGGAGGGDGGPGGCRRGCGRCESALLSQVWAADGPAHGTARAARWRALLGVCGLPTLPRDARIRTSSRRLALARTMHTNLKPARGPRPRSVIREELVARGWTQADLARIMGRSEETIDRIVNGQLKMTPEIARELAAALGTSAELWLNLQEADRTVPWRS